MKDPTIWRTSVCGCPACLDRRIHTSTDLETHHPYSGHGYDRMHWSHPVLEEEARKKSALRESDGLAVPGLERGRYVFHAEKTS